MHFSTPLIKGTLLKRYKRFLADVRLEDSQEVTVHCPNPGSMLGLKDPGMTVWLSPSNNPKRKLQYTLELVDTGTSLVGVNTNRANAIVEEALSQQLIVPLAHYISLRREVKYGKNSRIDFLLQAENHPDCYLEVKSVSLSRTPGLAEFPDATTARGAKHLEELCNMVREGHHAAMLYLVQRSDCDRFALANDIDPAYAEAFQAAARMGVAIHVVSCNITPSEITIGEAIPHEQA